MDALGHVNNGRYVDYLQDARVDFLFRTAKELGADALETGLLVARHEVQYRAPLHFRPEPVRIELWISEIRAGATPSAVSDPWKRESTPPAKKG